MKRLYRCEDEVSAWLAGWLCMISLAEDAILEVFPVKRQTLKQFKQAHSGWYEVNRDYYWCANVPGAN